LPLFKNITLFQLFGIFGEGKHIAKTSKSSIGSGQFVQQFCNDTPTPLETTKFVQSPVESVYRCRIENYCFYGFIVTHDR